MTISNFVRGCLLVPLLIPSVLITIFNLYHLFVNRALRTAANNHVVILLLCCGLFETLTGILWDSYFYLNGTVASATSAFCMIWTFSSSFGYISAYLLMAWASIERHILVFHQNVFREKRNRLYFHHGPLAFCILYPAMFYLATIVIMPCDAALKYNFRLCTRYSCILRVRWIALWDSTAHYIAPAFITIIFSVALFVRVLYRRYRVRGQIEWRNYRKLTAQLLPISFLYMVLQLPPMTMYAAYSAGVPYTVGDSYYSDGLYFSYWIILLTPFASVLSLPDLKTKCRKLLFWRRNRAVQPAVIKTTRHNDNQPTVIGTTARNITQPVVTVVAVRNVKQPEEIEMGPRNTNQLQASAMAHQNIHPPEAHEMVQQNVHQPFGGTMIHRHLDQPVSALPDVQ